MRVVIYHPSPQIPATPNLPSLSLGSNTKENPDETAERNNKDKDKNRYCLYTRQIVDLMRSLVNHWSPLTHASHCITTSWPATATCRMSFVR